MTGIPRLERSQDVLGIPSRNGGAQQRAGLIGPTHDKLIAGSRRRHVQQRPLPEQSLVFLILIEVVCLDAHGDGPRGDPEEVHLAELDAFGTMHGHDDRRPRRYRTVINGSGLYSPFMQRIYYSLAL
ncbi:hypothetical protein TPCV14_15610 [Cutibacterium avidum]|nr:hypothetical protein TPCV14_15610 [Cutibacterium avidum]